MDSSGLIRLVGIVAWLTLAAGIVGFALGGGRKLSALQLSGNAERVRAILEEAGGRGISRMKRQLAADYAFLFLYWTAFTAIAVVIARRGGAAYGTAALAAVLAATLTALLDVLENIRTRGVLALTRPGDQVRVQPVQHLRRTSLLKWTASATTVALLATAFMPGTTALKALGSGFLGLAAVGLVGVRWNRAIAAYLVLFLLLGGVIAGWFAVCPGSVVSRL